MKKSVRGKCESSQRTIAPGHGKFLNFAYPEMHSGAFSGQKSACLEVIVN